LEVSEKPKAFTVCYYTTYQAILFLTLPEQHTRGSGAQRRRKPKVGCKSFATLNLQVIRHYDVRKQRLQLVDSEITTRAEKRCSVSTWIRRPQGEGSLTIRVAQIQKACIQVTC
jgi:hypothetical protein